MKQGIHPEYRPVVFMDTTTGLPLARFSKDQVKQLHGKTEPHVWEITSDSHPFLHRSSKFTQADGRWTFQQNYCPAILYKLSHFESFFVRKIRTPR